MVKLLFLSSFGLGGLGSAKRASLYFSFGSRSESVGRMGNGGDKQGGQGSVILPFILALGALRCTYSYENPGRYRSAASPMLTPRTHHDLLILGAQKIQNLI